jgi:hypothetical protein
VQLPSRSPETLLHCNVTAHLLSIVFSTQRFTRKTRVATFLSPVSPQLCMKNDRMSLYEQVSLPYLDAMANEFQLGLVSLQEVSLPARIV